MQIEKVNHAVGGSSPKIKETRGGGGKGRKKRIKIHILFLMDKREEIGQESVYVCYAHSQKHVHANAVRVASMHLFITTYLDFRERLLY